MKIRACCGVVSSTEFKLGKFGDLDQHRSYVRSSLTSHTARRATRVDDGMGNQGTMWGRRPRVLCNSTLKPRLTEPRYSTAAAGTSRKGHASCRRQRRGGRGSALASAVPRTTDGGMRISALGKQWLSEPYQVEKDDRPSTFCRSFANTGKQGGWRWEA